MKFLKKNKDVEKGDKKEKRERVNKLSGKLNIQNITDFFNSNTIKKNRTMLGIGAIVFSLVINFIIAPIYNSAEQEKVKIVRVVERIMEGEKITEEKLKEVKVGKENLPTDVVRDIEEVKDMYAKADMYVDEDVLSTKITANPPTPIEEIVDTEIDKMIMSVTIGSFAKGLSAKLIGGDIVSIVATEKGEKGVTYIPDELRYVKVVAVTNSIGNYNKEYIDNIKDQSELPTAVTLLVNDKQAIKLAELEEKGSIHFALVHRGVAGADYLKVQDDYFKALPQGNKNTTVATEQKAVVTNENKGVDKNE